MIGTPDACADPACAAPAEMHDMAKLMYMSSGNSNFEFWRRCLIQFYKILVDNAVLELYGLSHM